MICGWNPCASWGGGYCAPSYGYYNSMWNACDYMCGPSYYNPWGAWSGGVTGSWLGGSLGTAVGGTLGYLGGGFLGAGAGMLLGNAIGTFAGWALGSSVGGRSWWC